MAGHRSVMSILEGEACPATCAAKPQCEAGLLYLSQCLGGSIFLKDWIRPSVSPGSMHYVYLLRSAS